MAASPRVNLIVAIPPGLEVGASSEVVQRILAQVLGNAYRYPEHEITVQAHRGPSLVELTVTANGSGVPPAFRENVFTPGHRANALDGHPGAGLGLALARRLARTAGGDITLTDEPEVGAALCITLPGA